MLNDFHIGYMAQQTTQLAFLYISARLPSIFVAIATDALAVPPILISEKEYITIRWVGSVCFYFNSNMA